MPKSGKEADINRRNVTLARPCRSEHKVAESRINVYAIAAREMCET
jgi:hypothetical protein